MNPAPRQSKPVAVRFIADWKEAETKRKAAKLKARKK
jgi:hypothetical protein